MVVVTVVPESEMEAAAEPEAAPAVVAKGKRTKRQRLLSPIPITIVPPSVAHTPPYTASSEESTTTEEENTAWCLVLLSQGHFENDNIRSSRRYDEGTTTSYGRAPPTRNSTCMYTCKTCNRSFSSFQALGGHRASHSKPKNEKKPALFSDDEDFPSPSYLQLSSVSTSPYSATGKSSPSPRMHVCSYCGAEFTSGQALGGHMRKHRGAGPINRSFSIARLEREEAGNGLSLDLNLPVADEEREKSPKEANERFCLPLLLHH